MSEIKLLEAGDFEVLVDIVANAYPGWKLSPDDQERLTQRLIKAQAEDPTVNCYGLFRKGQLLAGMRLHDFRMNCLGIRIPAAGIGLVAVHLAHKKEHAAKELIEFFLHHSRARGAAMAMLHPFRPDFYKQMGFGYGTKMNQYHVPPAALPRGPSKENVRFLGEEDKQALLDCYHRFVDRTHGMMEKTPYETQRLMQNPNQRVVGYEQDGEIRGYLVFTFETGENFLLNDIAVREFIFETPQALSELLTFLATQADQIRYIVFRTQDECFHHVLLDPRNRGVTTVIPDAYHETNIQGVGIMYHVLNTAGIFEQLQDHDFGGQTCRLKLTVEDSFFPMNAGSTVLQFQSGRVHSAEDGAHNVEICLNVSEFSSLLVGAVGFRRLCAYGLATISDPAFVATVDRLFAVRDKPVCTTPF